MKTVPAKFAGVCRGCGERYAVGETIAKLSEGWGHATHAAGETSDAGERAPSRPTGTTGGLNAEYEDVCPLCGTLWEAGEPLAFLSAWAAGRYLGDPPPLQDVWIHRRCLVREGTAGSLHPGTCPHCEAPYPAGTAMVKLGDRWLPSSCAQEIRDEIRQLPARLAQPMTEEDRLDLVLETASLVWPGCDFIESDVRVSKPDRDTWIKYVRPRLSGGTDVDAATFRKVAPDLYRVATDVLGGYYLEEYWDVDTQRYPDEICYPN